MNEKSPLMGGLAVWVGIWKGRREGEKRVKRREGRGRVV